MTLGIHAKEDEQQDGESPQRRTAITEERQRNADHGCQAYHHPHIDEEMEQEDAQYRIAIHAPHGVGLSLGQGQQPQDKQQIHEKHTGRPNETLFLSNGAEDEVGVLLRHILQLRLCAFQEPLAM